jgi:hypothetical protein
MKVRSATSAVALFAVVLWGVTMATPILRAQESSRLTIPALTDDSLKQMLDTMGYEPKKLSKGYLLAVKRDSWTINIQLVLSKDNTKLGFNANLGKVDDPDSVTAAQWKELLISNGDIDPSAFYFDKDQKKLYLHRSVDKRSIEPAFMRQQIDLFCGNVRGTEALWKFTK